MSRNSEGLWGYADRPGNLKSNKTQIYTDTKIVSAILSSHYFFHAP